MNQRQKFQSFLDIAKVLNKHGIIPTLYGSVGLYRIIGQLDEVGDIDIVVPDAYLKDRFNYLADIMKQLGYEKDPLYPHEFTKDAEHIGFESDIELAMYSGLNPASFKNTNVDGIEFKELNAEDYLVFYQKVAEGRKKKLHKDQIKIQALFDFLAKRE